MSNLTLQINSLEALERLIRGDSETEVEIRNNVVQRFAEKHLKPLINSDSATSTLNQIRQHVESEISTKVSKEIATYKKSDWYG